MKLNEYLEATYVATNVKQQVEYSTDRQAQIMATQNLIKLQLKVLTLIHMPLLLARFVLVALHLVKAPLTPQEQLKQQQEALEAKKEYEVKEANEYFAKDYQDEQILEDQGVQATQQRVAGEIKS